MKSLASISKEIWSHFSNDAPVGSPQLRAWANANQRSQTPQRTPNPTAGNETQDKDDDEDVHGMDISNYVSSPPSGSGSGGTVRRSERRNATMSTSQHFPQERTHTSIASERSEQARRFLPPRPGDIPSGGTPILRPGQSAPPPRNKPLSGGPRPRNDLGTKSAGRASVRRNENAPAPTLPFGTRPAAKRRKVEGDGFEQAVYGSAVRGYVPPSGKSEVELSQIRQQHARLAQPSSTAIEDIEDDDAVGPLPWRRGQRPVPPLKPNRITRPVKRNYDEFRRSSASPDPLLSDGLPKYGLSRGPEGPYADVQLVEPEVTDRKAEGQTRGTGSTKQEPWFGVRLWQYEKIVCDGTGLKLRPLGKSGKLFRLWRDDQDTGQVLRLKDMIRGLYHNESVFTCFELSSTSTGSLERLRIEFASLRHSVAFLQDTLPNIAGERFRAAKSAKQMVRIATDGWDPGSLVDSPRQPSPHYTQKLKDRMSNNSYTPGNIDETIRITRKVPQRYESLPKHNTRSQHSPLTNNKASHQEDDFNVKKPTPEPPTEKYSIKHGLGKCWASSFTFPSTGKNRATINFEDLYKLDEEEFLNDNIVNFYLRFLEIEMQKRDPAGARRVYWFNTYFYPSLTKDRPSPRGINYNAVKKWTQKIDIFDYDYVVVPIVENLHWYLAIICNLTSITRQVPDVVEQAGGDPEDASNNAEASAFDAAQLVETDYRSADEPTEATDTMLLDEDVGLDIALPVATTVTPTADNAKAPEVPEESNVEEVKSSQTSEISLIARPRPPVPDENIALQKTKSIDDIFNAMTSENDTRQGSPSSINRPQSRDQPLLPDALKNLLEELNQHSQVSDTAPGPEVQTVGDEHAVAQDEEIDLLDPSESTTTAPQKQTGKKSKKPKPTAPIRRFDPDAPSVITLDSMGSAHFAASRVLKMYLAAEAEDKRGGMQVDIKEIQGVTGTGIPNQTNFSDCGLYLLGYAEKFTQDPRQFVTKLLRRSFDAEKDWPDLKASEMRNTLRSLLYEKHDEAEGIQKSEKAERKKLKSAKRSHSLLEEASEDRKASLPLQTSWSDEKEATQINGDANAVTEIPAAPAGLEQEKDDQVTTESAPEKSDSSSHPPSSSMAVEAPSFDTAEERLISRDKALQSAIPLDETDEQLPEQAADSETLEAEETRDKPLPREDSFQVVEGPPPASEQKVVIKIPAYPREEMEGVFEIPQTPESSPPGETESKHFQTPRPPTPARPERDTMSGNSSATRSSKKGVARLKSTRRTPRPSSERPPEVIEID